MSDTVVFRVEQRAHNSSKAWLVLKCAHSKSGECRFSLWRSPAAGITWQWDGSFDAPTISPSVNCGGGCGRHFTITAGKIA